MARRKIDISSEGINYSEGTPRLQDIVNSVSEADYRDAIANIADVQAHWDRFKVERGSGRDLTMISGIHPDTNWNLKISKNAVHPNPVVQATHQMGMSLSPGDTSDSIETCGNCRTPQCTAICNAFSGKGAIPGGNVQRAQRTRTDYWAEHPQFAGALAVHESARGAAMARALGMIPALRTNMWADVNWARTNLRKPWVEDFEEVAGTRATGIAQDFPLMTHSNYTKETANRILRPGETEPEVGLPSNYALTMSISEQTPVERVRQRLESGRTARGVVWATPSQEKPTNWIMEDASGDREDFTSFDGDILDAVMHDSQIGNVGVGLLRQKQTRGLETLKGKLTTSSMVRPLDPDAPVGSRTGIPAAYASPETIERLGEVRPSRSRAFRGD